jgi:hypothetical protein
MRTMQSAQMYPASVFGIDIGKNLFHVNLPFPAISNRLESEKETPAQSLRTLFTDD